MSDHVRVGVIGTSWYADLMHMPNLKSHPGARVVAICGRNRDRAEELAAKYEIPRVFTDYRQMIAHGDLQAVLVATPDDLHYPMTMAALDRGLHVLCEKPMAFNAAQAREMAEKAEAAGVKHMVFFTYRWMPWFRYLRQLVDEGYLGRCYQCRVRYVGGYGRQPAYAWRWDRRRTLGSIADLGSHAVDWACWLVGDVARVSAHLATYVERPGPDGQPLDPANDAASLLLEFENGAQGMVQVSAVAHVGENAQVQEISLYGQSGTLELHYSWPDMDAVIRGARQDETAIRPLPVPDELWGDVDRSDLMSQFTGLFQTQPVGDRLFIDAILEDRPATPDFRDGLKVQRVIDAAVESDQSGGWVAVPRDV